MRKKCKNEKQYQHLFGQNTKFIGSVISTYATLALSKKTKQDNLDNNVQSNNYRDCSELNMKMLKKINLNKKSDYVFIETRKKKSQQNSQNTFSKKPCRKTTIVVSI